MGLRRNSRSNIAQFHEDDEVDFENEMLISKPRDNDILCGKTSECSHHPGSRAFRQVIEDHAALYRAADSKYQKMNITKDIYDMCAENESRFLKYNATREGWEELTKAMVRDKIGHALRFCNKRKKRKKNVGATAAAKERQHRRSLSLDESVMSSSSQSSSNTSHEALSSSTTSLPYLINNITHKINNGSSSATIIPAPAPSSSFPLADAIREETTMPALHSYEDQCTPNRVTPLTVCSILQQQYDKAAWPSLPSAPTTTAAPPAMTTTTTEQNLVVTPTPPPSTNPPVVPPPMSLPEAAAPSAGAQLLLAEDPTTSATVTNPEDPLLQMMQEPLLEFEPKQASMNKTSSISSMLMAQL